MAVEVTVQKITNYWNGRTLWEGEAEDLRAAVLKAVATGANLTDANLRGANLTDANLRGANLTDANLRGANLTDADLTDADLTGANLRGANLRGANLTDANLRGANLRGANLTGANLTDANLRGANLRGANLTGANLRGADLRGFRDDLWAVLSSAPQEAAAVLEALKAGKVDGSTYNGECACLVGTIANAAHCGYDALPILKPDSGRLAEVWFMQISPGKTPDNHQPTKLAAEWVADWLTRMRGAFGTPVSRDADASA